MEWERNGQAKFQKRDGVGPPVQRMDRTAAHRENKRASQVPMAPKSAPMTAKKRKDESLAKQSLLKRLAAVVHDHDVTTILPCEGANFGFMHW